VIVQNDAASSSVIAKAVAHDKLVALVPLAETNLFL